MARPSATAAALLLLLFSLVAVARCRPVEPQQPATDAESAAAVVVAAGDDENGPPNPTLPAEADQVVLPAAEQQPEHGFLRLPSHRLRRHHRPCRHGPFHRHLWWARHPGAFGDDDVPRRFHHHPDGEVVPSHLAVFHDVSREGEEPRAVAEPDPDRLIPDEVEAAGRELSFGDADGAHEEAVRAWKKEMVRRWFHHHGMRHHRGGEEESHEQEEEEAVEGGLKRSHHRRHHDEEDEEKEAMRKRFRGSEHAEDGSDDEDDEVEEIVRRFRKAIMRGRSGHGRRFHHGHHHHYGHRHDEDAQEEGGVVSWIKGLMNRF